MEKHYRIHMVDVYVSYYTVNWSLSNGVLDDISLMNSTINSQSHEP